MDELGNKTTLRKRLEPDYPDGLNTRLMFLDFILQAINPRLLGEQKKKNGITGKYQHSSRIQNGLQIKYLRQIS